MKTKKAASSQGVPQNQRFFIMKPEDVNIEFVDLVQANWNPERVIFSFVQTNPGGTMPSDSKEQLFAGRLVSQIAVTWPHLVRIRDLLDKAIKENKKSVIETTISSLTEAENSGGEKNE